MISRSNYELYVIDFYDGKLNKIQVEELYAFLEKNQDLKEEFELFSNTAVHAEEIIYENKNSLKKEDTSRSEILIAYFENDLSSSERKKVDQKIKSDIGYAQELEIIKKTRLLPDYTILFGDKTALKRSPKVIQFTRVFYRNISIAASVILIALAYFIFRPDRRDENLVADKNNVVTPVQSPLQTDSVHSSPEQNNKVREESNKDLLPSRNNFADRSSIDSQRRNKNKEKDSVKEERSPVVTPENNLAQQPKEEREIVPEVQQPLAGNSVPKNSIEKPAHEKPAQVADLSEIFSQQELAELGLAGTGKSNKTVRTTDNSQPANVLELAAARLKRFSDSKDIDLVKKENYIDDATTYAVNVGEKFSISHTRRR